jgi:hypothetical protein
VWLGVDLTAPASYTLSSSCRRGVYRRRPVDVRGCDIWAFDAEGKIVRKDSFWKIRGS